VSYVNTAHREHFLNHSQAERKAEIEPDGIGDDLWRETVAAIEVGIV